MLFVNDNIAGRDRLREELNYLSEAGRTLPLATRMVVGDDERLLLVIPSNNDIELVVQVILKALSSASLRLERRPMSPDDFATHDQTLQAWMRRRHPGSN